MNKTKLIVKTILDRSNKNALSFLNESTNINPKLYDTWFNKLEELKAISDEYSKVLNSEKWKKHSGSGGLIPYEIRNSEDYRKDLSNYDNADNNYKWYLKNSPKDYIKKRSDDSRAKRKEFMQKKTEEHYKNK